MTKTSKKDLEESFNFVLANLEAKINQEETHLLYLKATFKIVQAERELFLKKGSESVGFEK